MAVNINVELFKRYKPEKKLDLIYQLNADELLATTPETIKRIVKETGKRIDKSRNKVLRFMSEGRLNNGWNSEIEAVEYINGTLYLNIYLQMDSSDCNISEKYETFFHGDEYHGKHYTTNRYGDKIPNYFIYDKRDKIATIKAILLEYVYTKYADKL